LFREIDPRACKNGSAEVVDYLLTTCEADIEQVANHKAWIEYSPGGVSLCYRLRLPPRRLELWVVILNPARV
jgi:hypothetical protein